MNIETAAFPPSSRWPLVGLAALSAVLLPLGLPNELFNYGNAAIGIVCLVPVFIAISRAPTFGFASLLGVLFGALSTALANYWLMFFQGYSVWTYGGVILGYAGYNSLLFPFLRGFSRMRPAYRPFLLAAGWAVYEYFKSIGYLGFPWGLVAYPVENVLPLIQFIDVTGVWGLSLLMAAVNALIAEGILLGCHAAPPWDSRSSLQDGILAKPALRLGLFPRQAAFGLIVIALVLGYGLYRMAQPVPSTGAVKLLLVQQDIDPWNEGAAVTESVAINEELTLEGLRQSKLPTDLAVWSEGSVSSIWVMADRQFRPRNNRLMPFARQIGIHTFFGGVVVLDLQKQQFMNGAILMSPEGKVLDTYGKIHPVPFAENIPFSEHKAVAEFFRRVVGITNAWTMGSRITIFTAPLSSGGSFTFGGPICFEDAYSDLCRRFILDGADMWINLTNDYWSKTNSSEIQHFQVARLRAVENRRVLVRSTNGGVTAVVGPKGEILASLPLFERKWLSIEVPVYKERNLTFYTRFGDYFPQSLGIVLLLLLIANLFQKKRYVFV